jgi:hypothetical protein
LIEQRAILGAVLLTSLTWALYCLSGIFSILTSFINKPLVPEKIPGALQPLPGCKHTLVADVGAKMMAVEEAKLLLAG